MNDTLPTSGKRRPQLFPGTATTKRGPDTETAIRMEEAWARRKAQNASCPQASNLASGAAANAEPERVTVPGFIARALRRIFPSKPAEEAPASGWRLTGSDGRY